MEINEWFDIENMEHIRAYYFLQKRGVWPRKFTPDNITFNQGWQIVLMHRFASAYIDDKIASITLYRDGEPCINPKCKRVTLPCEACGRFRAEGEILEES